MIKQDKHKLIKITVIVLLITASIVAIYLWVAYKNSFWPFYSEPQSQTYEDGKNSLQGGTLQNARQSTSATNNSPDTSVSNDGYLEGKTPVQYEGQTDGSNTHGDYNNEQFRIPEDEL